MIGFTSNRPGGSVPQAIRRMSALEVEYCPLQAPHGHAGVWRRGPPFGFGPATAFAEAEIPEYAEEERLSDLLLSDSALHHTHRDYHSGLQHYNLAEPFSGPARYAYRNLLSITLPTDEMIRVTVPE